MDEELKAIPEYLASKLAETLMYVEPVEVVRILKVAAGDHCRDCGYRRYGDICHCTNHD
jgi:hypothetical protein